MKHEKNNLCKSQKGQDTKKDVLHTTKLIIQLDTWNFLLDQIIKMEKEIQDKKGE